MTDALDVLLYLHNSIYLIQQQTEIRLEPIPSSMLYRNNPAYSSHIRTAYL